MRIINRKLSSINLLDLEATNIVISKQRLHWNIKFIMLITFFQQQSQTNFNVKLLFLCLNPNTIKCQNIYKDNR